MYEKIEIWKRVSESLAIKFQCLKRISDDMFAVQSGDYFRIPLTDGAIKASDTQFIELMLDTDPTDRCNWYVTLIEAINRHEQDFS